MSRRAGLYGAFRFLMSRWLAILATFAAGALVALQPPANAELGKRVGTLGAAFVSLSVSLGLVAIALAIAGGFRLGVLGLTEIRFDWSRVLSIVLLLAGTALMTLRYEQV